MSKVSNGIVFLMMTVASQNANADYTSETHDMTGLQQAALYASIGNGSEPQPAHEDWVIRNLNKITIGSTTYFAKVNPFSKKKVEVGFELKF